MAGLRMLAGVAAVAGTFYFAAFGPVAAADELDCGPIIEAIQLGEPTENVVADAVTAGGDPGAVGLCAVEAGAEVDDILAGLDQAGVEPDVVAQLADELETAAGALGEPGGIGPTDITNPPLGEPKIVRDTPELGGSS